MTPRHAKTNYFLKEGLFDNLKSFSDLEKKISRLSTHWEEMYQALVSYKSENGDCNVPRSYPEKPALATWVGGQRSAYKSNSLSPDKIKRLERLGFRWNIRSISRKTFEETVPNT